ncbi:hypothetical protein [Dickeya chrysanthemi]|uniref:hypothetical protein n=1 Tax=Dickeya chrysanthemi TaxID=556 RepID=UPI000532D7DC|nr:hypothetical protein [Dickeya chrysanthemi]
MIRNLAGGDIVTHGDQFVTGKEETRQAILCRLRLFLGEYFLNVTEGTDWFGSVLGKTTDDIAAIEIQRRILSTPGVVGITKFELVRDARERQITVYASVVDINNEQIDFAYSEDV